MTFFLDFHKMVVQWPATQKSVRPATAQNVAGSRSSEAGLEISAANENPSWAAIRQSS